MKITIEAVTAAYKQLGALPISGTYRFKHPAGQMCYCPLTALIMANDDGHLCVDDLRHMVKSTFGGHFACGFMDGYDGYLMQPAYKEDIVKYTEGYDNGVWISQFIKPGVPV